MELIEAFAKLLEEERISQLRKDKLDCQDNINNVKTSIKLGRKYTKVDVGYSGAYMVVNATGEIFGIKAYGVIHKGHCYGTLDTINEWYWGRHRAIKKFDASHCGL